MNELGGLWRRSLLVGPDGRADRSTEVRWLQTPTRFGDLRQPAPVRLFPAVRRQTDLTWEDCAWLARQQAFAGRLRLEGADFLWQRTIDYQPATGLADAGSLTWEEDVLVERGRDIDYLEHWHRDGSIGRQPTVALELRDTENATCGCLLRVAGVFCFARDRAMPLTGPEDLSTRVAGARDLRHAQALLDCEVSFGVIDAAGLKVTHSTLPQRIGMSLHPQRQRDRLLLPEMNPEGADTVRSWEIVDVEGEMDALC